MGWANRITLVRAALTLAVWGLVVWATRTGDDSLWYAACAIFVVAGASDFVDGMLARRQSGVLTAPIPLRPLGLK